MENSDAFDCQNCQWGNHCSFDNPAPTPIFQIHRMMTDKDGKSSQGKLVHEQSTCFKSERTTTTDQWYELFVAWRDKILPLDAGYLELPNYFLEVMKTHQYYEDL